MQIFYQNEIEDFQPCVATVGIFDGVHAGHRFLIEQVKEFANALNIMSVVITFAKHPRSVLNPEFSPEILNTLPEKLQQLESTGIDACIVLDFTIEMGQLSAYNFLKTILFQKFNVQTLLVGHDHRFGRDRKDGFPEYLQYGKSIGMKVMQATRFRTALDELISSSEIRNLLQKGDIEHANRLLNYNYNFCGKVIDGFKVGRKIGFPTANIFIENQFKLIPAMGVYAVQVLWNNQFYKGMLNIGVRPTLNGTKVSLEVHIIDFNEDIYNQIIEIYFIRKIRDEKKFDGIDELIEQLKKDKQQVIEMNY
ncbi:MAG: riboflavin biosynthesis protein RibF [Paludibacter sp.]